MTRVHEGLPVSIQVRLARHARELGMDPNRVLARFATERFLYRLSRSPFAERFVLKGALLMCACAIAVPFASLDMVGATQMGTVNVWTGAIFTSSLMLPVGALLAVLFTIDAWRNDAGPWFRSYALVVSASALVSTVYLWSWGMIAFRPWDA